MRRLVQAASSMALSFKSATYQRGHVQPFADFRRVDYVQILTSRLSGTAQASVVPGP